MASDSPETAVESGAPRWRRRKADRPSEIMSAALQEFLAHGYEATRLEDVARRAGCTKGTIFLYFPGKAELFKTAVREALFPILQSAEQDFSISFEGSMRELLERLLRTRWSLIQNSGSVALGGMILANGGRFPDIARFYHDEVLSRSHALYTRILEMGVARGEFRPLDAPEVARVVMAPLLLGMVWRQSFNTEALPPFDGPALIEAQMDQFFRGIAAEPQRGMA